MQDKPNGESRVSVNLTAEQHDLAFKAALKEAKTQLERAVETFDELWESAGKRTVALSDDAQLNVKLLREDLELLDAIGWPERVQTARR